MALVRLPYQAHASHPVLEALGILSMTSPLMTGATSGTATAFPSAACGARHSPEPIGNGLGGSLDFAAKSAGSEGPFFSAIFGCFSVMG